MNFPKMLILIGVAAVVIGGIVFFTGVDRSDPAAVATAFAKAMKKQDTEAAAGFYLPDKAQAWRTAMDEKIGGMQSGTFERYFERIPADPVFTTPAGASGKVTLQTAEKDMSLDLTQVESKWYVSGTAL